MHVFPLAMQSNFDTLVDTHTAFDSQLIKYAFYYSFTKVRDVEFIRHPPTQTPAETIESRHKTDITFEKK